MSIKKFHKKFHGGGVCYLMMIKSKIATSFHSYLKDRMSVFKILKNAISRG